jgi:hypothetical protein
MAAANTNFQTWIRDTWDGDATLALAYCVDALAESYGHQWDAISENHQKAHLWLFSFLCPRREDMGGEAAEYRSAVEGKGGPARVGDRILFLKGW